jgi:hypothetical protein
MIAVVLTAGTAASANASSKYESPGARHAICRVWGSHCSLGLAIAYCESKLDLWARNGQYVGLFQMGSSERRKYGDSRNVWGQARSAFAYFRDSGTSPWRSSQFCWG